MKMLTIVNKMAADMETDINATNVIMLNVTVRTVCDAGIPCCNKHQRTNGPVNAHLSLLHIPINMFEYYGI